MSKENALTGLARGKPERNGRIYTPQPVVDALLGLWPDGIDLDPCSGPDSLVPARMNLWPDAPETETTFPADSLELVWSVGTCYVNPPYGRPLKSFLAKLAKREPEEQAALIPVRPHRKWWRACVFEAEEICWLDPLKFVGYSSSFPAPLCVVYWGEARDVFREAFAGLGGFQ